MKKIASITFVLAIISLWFTSCKSDSKENSYVTIDGEIKGLKTGTLYFQMLQDSTLNVVDSIVFDGKSTFQWKYPLESPEMLYLFLDRGVTSSIDNILLVFAEPGKMTLRTELDKFYSGAQIDGSVNHDLWEQYLKMTQRLNNENVALIEAQFKAMREKNETKLDSLERRQEAVIKRKYLQAINFALNHKDKDIAPYLALSEIYDAQKRFLDSIYNSLTPQVREGKYGKMLGEELKSR